MEGKSSEVTEYVGITIGSRNSSATLMVETEVLANVIIVMPAFPVHLLCAPAGGIMVDLVELFARISINILKCLNENVNLHN